MFAKICISLFRHHRLMPSLHSDNAHGVLLGVGTDVSLRLEPRMFSVVFCFLPPSVNTALFEIRETNSVSSSYGQILNEISTPLLLE